MHLSAWEGLEQALLAHFSFFVAFSVIFSLCSLSLSLSFSLSFFSVPLPITRWGWITEIRMSRFEKNDFFEKISSV